MELKTENGSDETKTTEILTDEETGIENVVNDLDNFVNDKIKMFAEHSCMSIRQMVVIAN